MKQFLTIWCGRQCSNNRIIKLSLLTLLSAILYTSVSAKSIIDDSDGDGLSDQYEEKIGTEAYLSDTDGDGVNDGIEVGKNLQKPLNSDNDKRIDALDYDDDNDGLPTFLESKNDTDKDGLKDYLDTDSDNDGLADGKEAGVLNQDKNFDGIDDAFDLSRVGTVDKNGDGIDDNLKLPDYNQDGIADYLDEKYRNDTEEISPTIVKDSPKLINKLSKKPDNKTIPITIKSGSKKDALTEPVVTEKKVVNRYTDSDNDGLLDTQERILGTNPFKRDSDGDKVSDAIEIGMDINKPQDSDHDNIIDALDEDDDNDGILTKNEDINQDSTAINDDTDEDGVPNYLDANDDGDDRLTRDEGSSLDSDKDGIPDYLDKNDGVKDSTPQLATKEKIPEEPEVVVLFDGDAAALVAADKSHESEEMRRENLVENVAIEMLKEINLDNVKREEDQQAINQLETKQKSFKTSKITREESAKSHWTLF